MAHFFLNPILMIWYESPVKLIFVDSFVFPCAFVVKINHKNTKDSQRT